MKPLLYDLYCCSGGATKGYQLAGFRVIGVDCKPQPRYIGDDFILIDSIDFLERYISGEYERAKALHASPPCQAYSYCTKLGQRQYYKKLISATRYLFEQTKLPYVIENVLGAKKSLRANILLCGTMFGLPIHRHRLFESHPPLAVLTPPCAKNAEVVYITGSRRDKKGNYVREPSSKERKDIMGMPWATIGDIDEAIPPIYTEFIGKYLMEQINSKS